MKNTPPEPKSNILARFILLRTIGWLLILCAAGATAQEPLGYCVPTGPRAENTSCSVASLPPIESNYSSSSPSFTAVPDARPLTFEPLPPVEPRGVAVPPLPPLLNHVETAGATASSSGTDASPKPVPTEESSKKEKSAEMPEDSLPRMFETAVIEKTPLYDMDVPLLDPWKGNFELGLDGSSGNSNTFNVRLGAAAKRKTKKHSWLFDLDYHKNTNDGVETANKMYFESRYERLSQSKPWTWFFKETTDYDEFQPWNVRVVATGGLGYRVFDDEVTNLTARLGSGFSQEIGGPDQDCIPEMNYGFDCEHRMTKRQKISCSVEYYPNVVCFNEYRVTSKADWEVLLDADMNLSLKISAMDIYNYPNPGGKLNDLDYAIVLLWNF